MIRHAILAFAALAALSLAAQAEPAPRLRSAVTVSGPLVTLGDLFSDAGTEADTAVFQAPDPGTTGSVSASRVLAAATAHGLDPAPTGVSKVSVTRASRVVGEADLKRAIADALAAEISVDGPVEIEFDGAKDGLHVEADALAPLAVRDFDYDPATSRFAAVVAVPDSDVLGQGTRVTGRAMRIVELPVPQRQIKRGDTIGPADVAMQRLPLSRAPDDAVRSLAEIVGKSARSTLQMGAPVPADRLMEPLLVGRNDAVTIVYRSGGLVLSVRGRALAEGARGDLVTVMNAQSNRTIEAIVSGPGQVVVEPPRQLVASAAGN